MLNDRDYMRSPGGNRPGGGGMPRMSGDESARRCVWGLILANVVVFFMVRSAPNLIENLALSSFGLKHGSFYQLVTAMFLQYEFLHLFFNMWGLYIFGMLVAPLLGAKRFLGLYLVGGLAGNLLFLAFNWYTNTRLLGASGALFGIMMAVAMLLPNVRFMLIFPPMPIKASTMVIVFAIIELVSQGVGGGNISHLAHLGGFVGGYLMLKLYFGNHVGWDPLGRIARVFSGRGPRPKFYQPPPPGRSAAAPERPDVDDGTPISREEVDFLLDKISHQGINSLTLREHARLRRAREELRKR